MLTERKAGLINDFLQLLKIIAKYKRLETFEMRKEKLKFSGKI